MRKKKVNAGLKSREELYTRLIEGEMFDSLAGILLCYRPSFIRRGESPFRFGPQPMSYIAYHYKLFTTEVDVEWYEEIVKPVLCWVSDTNADQKKFLRLVTHYYKDSHNPFHFRAEACNWRYATPVTQEDLLQ